MLAAERSTRGALPRRRTFSSEAAGALACDRHHTSASEAGGQSPSLAQNGTLVVATGKTAQSLQVIFGGYPRPSMTLSRPPANSFRHAAFVLAALVLVVLSCGPELTAPRGGASRVARGISFSPVFPAVLSQVASDASGIVDFNRVHIVLRHGDGTVALDTVVNYPAGADSLLVSLDVSLALGTPDTGEPLAMTLGYINAAGDTVFKGGPVTVNAVPALPGAPPPPPVSIPVAYTGPGASATSVVISPRSTTVFAGDPFSFTAVAKDVNGNVLAGTPIVWASLNPAVATIASPVAGNGVAQNVRGSAQITAQLLTGPSDAVSVSVLLRASTIAAVSGASQAAVVNSALPQPLVVRVTASDGVGVAGVAVTFAAGTGGGTVGTANATTDAGGLAQTTFTLGATPGTQTVTATATGLSGSPVTFAETANAPPATQLVFTTQPANGTAGVVLANVVVTAKDAGGATATSFTGAVTLAFGSTPGGVTLGGTTTVNAVAGVATFSTLNITRAAAGYTLVALANGVTSTTSSTFAIAAAAASSIVADSGGAQAGLAGALLGQPFVVRVLDAFSNPVPNVTVTWAVTAGGGSLTATTSTTDVNGRARVTLTLGATGANTVSASVGGAGTVSFTATAVSAGPTQLVFVTQPSNVTAGIPIAASPVVQARDASNNPVPSFTGNVTITIGTNPGGATLGGTVTVAAAAGNATLANLRLNKIGAGYTLVASAAGLTSATSGTFNVTAAPAIAIAADSGAGQVGTTGSALAQQLVARVTDSLGNPVSGTPVAWSVLSGGGVLGGATTSTDVNGRVRAAWTLGGVVGAQSAQVASVGLAGSPVAFGATGLIPGANKQWTGATSNAWNVATNWLPNGVPVATDSVVIVPITNQAVVSTAVAVKHLLVQAGAILTNNGSITTTGNLTIVAAGTIQNAGGSITVGGNLDATGGIIGGAGTVTLSGAANRTVLGAISATSTTISGPGLTTLASQLIVSGDLTIDTGTDVDLNGQILVVGAGNVLTATGGTLTLTNIASTLNVQTGNLTFQGGSEAGKLTSGTINFAGPALNASVTPFTAGPGLTFNFSGGGAQTFTGTPTFGTMFVVNVAGVPRFSTYQFGRPYTQRCPKV